MKKIRRMVMLPVCSLVMACGCFQSVYAQADTGISVLSENSSDGNVVLTFSQNKAKCSVLITGKSGTSKISGTLKLYDEAAKKTTQAWSVSKNGDVYSESFTVTVLSGHKYTLSFKGTVYNASHVGESITRSTTKTN